MEDDMNAIHTAEDLKRVFIRAQRDDGRWDSICVADVTDGQSDAWARSRMPIHGDDTAWPLQDRVAFCQYLYNHQALTVLKKQSEEEQAQ